METALRKYTVGVSFLITRGCGLPLLIPSYPQTLITSYTHPMSPHMTGDVSNTISLDIGCCVCVSGLRLLSAALCR